MCGIVSQLAFSYPQMGRVDGIRIVSVHDLVVVRIGAGG